MLGNYLQQTTSADNIFRCIFFLALLGLILIPRKLHLPVKNGVLTHIILVKCFLGAIMNLVMRFAV